MSVPTTLVVVTKLGDTAASVQMLFVVNNSVRYAVAIPAADFTAFNTTVNGGATGANLSRTYGEDSTAFLLPTGYVAP